MWRKNLNNFIVYNENRYELIFKRINKMKIKEAIQVLKDHNIWRKGENEEVQMTDPKKLGVAIDTVVNKFENLFISDVTQCEATKTTNKIEEIQVSVDKKLFVELYNFAYKKAVKTNTVAELHDIDRRLHGG
ncbi:hypothetical protein Phi13:2_gp035 [Cellulophaga phage phi13:2]|uniref:Uncharacterized protein n=1 Tax=Cellulophaga phage phi13:2 TaxID=1328030 RepID=S0A4E2_9CAUD|nr:hypothetical protein Phi13:2_gp035 [Cellulophaga phage phi13:2]AGO49645.1 hypothetical protein Phi13:2_gp035 [Cellulophaga phage phi13:2]